MAQQPHRSPYCIVGDRQRLLSGDRILNRIDGELLEYTDSLGRMGHKRRGVDGSVTVDDDVRVDLLPAADDPRIHHGVWRFRVSYYDTDSRPMKNDKPGDAAVIGTASALADATCTVRRPPPRRASPTITPGPPPAGSSGMT